MRCRGVEAIAVDVAVAVVCLFERCIVHLARGGVFWAGKALGFMIYYGDACTHALYRIRVS
jgi:hypothetical protein